MHRLLRDAHQILEAASAAPGSPLGLQQFAIVVTESGGIRMLEAAGWNTAALQAETGAAFLYRVERAGGRVRVEGSSPGYSCTLEARRPDPAVRSILGPPASSLARRG